MYTGVYSDVALESYFFELFEILLNVSLKIRDTWLILCIPVDSFDLKCESVT